MNLLPLLCTTLLGGELEIDAFEYADTPTVRRFWVAAERTPPVELVTEDSQTVLQLAAPFAADPKLSRSVIDRRVHLDLSAVGEFTLEVATDFPEAVGHLTLYLRSGEGWYAGGGAVGKKGWQTIRFAKASFGIEGQPAGWSRIDGVRIAAWRGAAIDSTLRLRRLAAVTHEIALVVPPATARAANGELRAARDSAALVAGLLEELGLGADAIEETAVVQGALGQRRVAILAYNPRLGDETTAVLEQFMANGGKVFVCYTLPPRLGRALGFGNAKYVRPEQPGTFARVVFERQSVPGLPAQISQASWNIAAAEPVGHNARVIGRWHDESGKPTGHAALLLSDRGAFFSHIILADDPQGKQQMLAALLGHLDPLLWKQMGQAAVERIGQVGHCGTAAEVAAYVEQGARAEPLGPRLSPVTKQRLEEARTSLLRAQKSAREAADLMAKGQYPDVMRAAHAARSALTDAYLRGTPSAPREGRATWNHSGSGAYPGDWQRSAKELAAGGFNMVLPNMLWGGLAHYPSDILPRSDTFRQHGDQIEQCVAACKKHDVQVHVWKVNFNLANAPREFVEKLRRQGRTQVTAKGEPQDWLCPSHPENRQLELDSMLEVARKYAVNGLHFDYIRYPNRECCYCDGCRRRFEAETGRPVTDWPRDCYSGPRKDAYHDWRCAQITALVAAVHREGKKLRPDLKISAAVFGAYPSCRESVGQDWPEWVKAGYLDFVCPMDYTPHDEQFRGWVENQRKLVGGRLPLYPGIGATATRISLSADRVVGQIRLARELGAEGFCIFNFDRGTAGSIIPGVGLGAGAQRATPPHDTPIR